MNKLFATVCGGLLIAGLTAGCGTARAPSAARPGWVQGRLRHVRLHPGGVRAGYGAVQARAVHLDCPHS